MKWLEIIELRTAGSGKKAEEAKWNYLINELNKSMKKISVTVFNHATLESDFSIHLFHHSEPIEKSGSSLELHLVSELKNYAMVNHSIWVEKDTSSENDF